MNGWRHARRCLGGFVASIAVATIIGPSPFAQAKRPMTLLDIAELPRIILPQLSPDGKTLIYLQSRADWKIGRPVWHLWRQDVGGAPAQLTTAPAGVIPFQPRWSPDGKTILFVLGGQLQTLPRGGGEPHPITHHATLPTAPTWSPDGSTVYFIAADPATAAENDRDRVRDDVYAYDEDYKQRRLWKVVVATGDETQITTGDSSVLEYHVSRDGTRIAFHRAPNPLAGDAYLGEVWVSDANGANARALTKNGVEEVAAELSPDNSQMLFLADTNERFEPYYNTNLFLVPAAGGTPRALFPDYQYAFDQATWSADGTSILAVVNMGVHNEIVEIDVASRRLRPLTEGSEHFIPYTGWSVVPSAGQMLVQRDEPSRFGDLWTLPIGKERATFTRVTHLFDAMERDFAIPRQEKVTWKSADGATIEGLLFYPVDYRPGTRYPLVVQLHGGPMESDKFGAGVGLLQHYFPVLAGKGYAVFRPNYRGSAGYGNAFYRDVVGHFFQNMQHDVLSGVDHLVKAGIADPDRIVAMGWSAGGHLTNKLITMTDRFKAVSSGASVAEWMSFYAQTDVRSFRVEWFGGAPWDKTTPLAAFWDHSPLKDASNIKTPTLLFIGENDSRVPLAQPLEMYRALKSRGVPTHLYVAPRDGHQWQELRHLIFKANAELEWFERYARGREYTWEKAPQ